MPDSSPLPGGNERDVFVPDAGCPKCKGTGGFDERDHATGYTMTVPCDCAWVNTEATSQDHLGLGPNAWNEYIQ